MKELTINQWYKHKIYNNTYVCYTGNSRGYGFWMGTNEWETSLFVSNTPDYVLADIETIKTLLLGYAKNNYSKGDKYESFVSSNTENTVNADIFKTKILRDNIMVTDNGNVIFYEGKWAKIIKKHTPELKKDYQNCMDIKVGDTVKCISENISEFTNNNGAGVGWKKDLEFVVTDITENEHYNVYWGGNRGNGVYSDAIRLVKRKEVVNNLSNITKDNLRNFYFKVDSQNEANKMLDYLESIGEPVMTDFRFTSDSWCYIVFNDVNKGHSHYNSWSLNEKTYDKLPISINNTDPILRSETVIVAPPKYITEYLLTPDDCYPLTSDDCYPSVKQTELKIKSKKRVRISKSNISISNKHLKISKK